VPAIRGLTVSVGYADMLRITLPRNMRHQVECVVISSPEDEETRAVVDSVPGARLSVTDAFTRYGARFNKGLAIEEAGFDVLGRDGWIAVWDADCLWPDSLPLDRLRPDALHGARRRVLENPALWHPAFNWADAPPHRDGSAPIGFLQIFHADAPALMGKRPWYDVSFPHAGGGDAAFLSHWGPHEKIILPIEVLHLGPTDSHWFGTSPEAIDLMARFVTENGWNRAAAKFDAEAVRRAGELPGRVEVPGYPRSDYELPFVRRAQRG
jgi:hypothetical protein